ncbi:MFS transporter [Trabulsiella odontotermitis]|nr:MFS transporter [Trabulsiella odontotermitis]
MQSVPDRIDALPGNRALWKFIALLASGGFFGIYDLMQTGYISTGLIAEGIFHSNVTSFPLSSDQGVFAFLTFAGLFIGAGLLTPLADKFGRRQTFMYALLGYSTFSLIMALQTQSHWVMFFRFLTGVGLGLEMVTIDTYLSEWVPRQLRSRAFAFSFFIQFLSVPVLALLSWWLVPQTIFGLSGWRWVVINGATSALVIWFIRKKLPESPRWLMAQGRHLEAHHLITAMESRCGLPAKPLAPRSSEDKQNAPGAIVTLSGRYRKRILLLVTMNIFQAIGFFGFGNWLPSLLAGKGTNLQHSLLYAFFITLAYPLTSFLCSRYADRTDNKWQIVLSSLLTVISGTLFAFVHYPPALIFCGFLITASNAWLTCCYHAWQTELFPTAVRASLSGFCYSFSRLSTAFSSIFISWLLSSSGPGAVLAFIVSCMVIVMGVVGVFGPQTRGRSLEDI